MCNHWKQNVIQSRFNFPDSQCIPVCGATSRVVRVHHHHVLISTKLGQTLSVVVRMHTVILPTSCHGLSLSPNSMLLVPDVACVQRACSGHLRPPRSIGTVRRVHFVSPLVQPVCRPVAKWWKLEPHKQEVQLRRFTLMAPLLPCTPACGEATSRICQVSQMSSLTATMRPACRFVPRPIP